MSSNKFPQDEQRIDEKRKPTIRVVCYLNFLWTLKRVYLNIWPHTGWYTYGIHFEGQGEVQDFFFDCTYFDMYKLWKNSFSTIIFLEWMLRLCHLLHLFTRYTIYHFFIENRSVKRANSHFTICLLLTRTHIIF